MTVVRVARTERKWRGRAVREGHVLQNGSGTRKEPYAYHLPGMVEKWQANFVADFTRRLEREAGRAAPAQEQGI